jgi:hypothetical protein
LLVMPMTVRTILFDDDVAAVMGVAALYSEIWAKMHQVYNDNRKATRILVYLLETLRSPVLESAAHRANQGAGVGLTPCDRFGCEHMGL